MGELILNLLHIGTNAHVHHWLTGSYAQHMALGTFYEELPELVDSLAEAIMGATGKKIDFPEGTGLARAETPLEELEAAQEYFKNTRGVLPDDSEIQNLADSIADLIDSTVYKLRFLS